MCFHTSASRPHISTHWLKAIEAAKRRDCRLKKVKCPEELLTQRLTRKQLCLKLVECAMQQKVQVSRSARWGYMARPVTTLHWTPESNWFSRQWTLQWLMYAMCHPQVFIKYSQTKRKNRNGRQVKTEKSVGWGNKRKRKVINISTFTSDLSCTLLQPLPPLTPDSPCSCRWISVTPVLHSRLAVSLTVSPDNLSLRIKQTYNSLGSYARMWPKAQLGFAYRLSCHL